MSLESEFPGLSRAMKETMISTDTLVKDAFKMLQILITKHCLDKERTRRAIDKVLPTNDEMCAEGIIRNAALKKELGL